jgi:cullin-associated NEDD8-dissociated protein 1
VAELIPGVLLSLTDKASNSNLKVEALTFTRLMLATHPAAAFVKHVAELAPVISKGIVDPYFRISAEALRVASELVPAVRESGGKPHAQALLKSTEDQLKRADADQDVKEAALSALGSLLTGARELLSPQEAANCVKLLVERLKNETTRLAAAKVFSRAVVAAKADIAPAAGEAGAELAGLLRKSSRPLRLAALAALSALVEQVGTAAPPALFGQVTADLAPLVSDSDLQLTQLAIQLSIQILKGPGAAAAQGPVADKLLPVALELTKSSLLQGGALQALVQLFAELAGGSSKSLTYEGILEQLLKKASEASKPALPVVAQCVASATAAAKQAQRDGAVTRFARDVQKSKEDPQRVIALLCLGETGRRTNLAAHYDLLVAVFGAALDSPVEDVKQAASIALGGVTVGCMDKFLPFVLDQVTAHPTRQYLLLHSLRVIITDGAAGAALLRPYLAQVLKLLFSNCEAEEEGTRGVVSECLGRLALICPAEVLPEVEARLTAKNPRARATAIGTLKYAIVDADSPVDALVTPRITSYLNLLADPDLHVRRAAITVVNFVSHHKSKIIRPVLAQFISHIYGETRIRPELIREVELGPFKHKVDDGLDLRKSAFECLYTLLDAALDRIEVLPFIQNIVRGLTDHNDLKLLSHMIIVRLAATAGPLMLTGLDLLVDPLKETVTAKVKDQAVKQEVERNEELVRSALRAVAAIAKVPGADTIPKFREFMHSVVLSADYIEKYKLISKEANVSSADFAGPSDMDTTP